jgi:hypothetical protein
MKRRGFLAVVGAAVAAIFMPAKGIAKYAAPLRKPAKIIDSGIYRFPNNISLNEPGCIARTISVRSDGASVVTSLERKYVLTGSESLPAIPQGFKRVQAYGVRFDKPVAIWTVVDERSE